MRRLAAVLVLALGFASIAGCGRAGARVQTGIDYYEHGAYEGALLKLRDIGPEEGSLRTKTRTRYFVYRGLAHWHMSQTEDARRYLGEARKAFDAGADPKWIPSDVREELARAELDLGLARPGADGAHPAGPHSSPPDHAPPAAPPDSTDGAPHPTPDVPTDKAPSDGSPSPLPSSPTSSPGAAPTPTLPPNTAPAPDMM